MCGGWWQFDISPHHFSVKGLNNVTLKCLVEEAPDSCFSNDELQWLFFDRPLKSGEKYEIQERKTKTKCETDFVITIFSVTYADEGKYSCKWLCNKEYSRSSTIQLKVFPSLTGMNNYVIISSAFSKAVRVGETFRYKEEVGKKINAEKM